MKTVQILIKSTACKY